GAVSGTLECFERRDIVEPAHVERPPLRGEAPRERGRQQRKRRETATARDGVAVKQRLDDAVREAHEKTRQETCIADVLDREQQVIAVQKTRLTGVPQPRDHADTL